MSSVHQGDIWSFLLSVAIFGGAIIASQPTWPSNKLRLLRGRLKPQTPLHHRAWQAFVIAATIGGILAVIDQFWGRPWPTTPEIHPHDVLNGSSVRLPFTIKNISAFDIRNARMTCGIDWVYLTDHLGHAANFAQMAFVNQTISIGRGQTVNYGCDPSEAIKVHPDGTWSFGVFPGVPPIQLWPPIDFQKMCVWIRGDYTLFGIIPWSFTSAVFEWPSAPGVPQWLEGPSYRDGTITRNEWIPNRTTIPPRLVVCDRTPQKAAVIFNGDGTVTFMGKTLKVPQK